MWILPEDVDSNSLLDSSRDSKIWDSEESKMMTYLFNSALDNGVNDEVCLRDFDILLQMKKRQFKLGNFFFRHRNS